MKKTCICPGVEEAAKYSYKKMIDAGSSRRLAEERAIKILNGEWVLCKCEASKGE